MQTRLKDKINLRELRERYYNDLVIQLSLLETQKKTLITNYNTVVKELDKQIGDEKNGKKDKNSGK